MTRKAITDELLSNGLDDMLGLWWIVGVVARYTEVDPNDDQGIMAPTLDAIRELLASNYAIAGDVATNDEGVLYIQSWRTNVADTVNRIRRDWEALDAPPNLGDVVWLELTEAGRERARDFSA